MKNLATVQKIKNVRPHTNADTLELADVLGWQVVVKKGEFKTGDLAVYIVIDTVLPEKPEFEFLRNKHFRINPIRLRKEYSAGILFPLSVLPEGTKADENTDVTDVLGVTHYEKPVPVHLAGEVFGYIPTFIIKTDEDNLRSFPAALEELVGKPYYITRKDDGTSGTFFINNGEFGVCSRNLHLKPNKTNAFWRMAEKYAIEASLKALYPDRNIALQGEVVGPNVCQNHLGLKELEFHAFSLLDINKRTFLPYRELVDFCHNANMTMVTLVEEGNAFGHKLQELIDLSKLQKYPNDKPAEGIVIRAKEPFYSVTLQKEWSGKVLNELFSD